MDVILTGTRRGRVSSVGAVATGDQLQRRDYGDGFRVVLISLVVQAAVPSGCPNREADTQ